MNPTTPQPKPDRTINLARFMENYEMLSPSQQAFMNCWMTWSFIVVFIKHPTRSMARAVWDAFSGLVLPSLSPVVLPVLVFILAVLIYAAIGARVEYAGALVQLLAAAGCLAGAAIGRGSRYNDYK